MRIALVLGIGLIQVDILAMQGFVGLRPLLNMVKRQLVYLVLWNVVETRGVH